MMTIDYGPPLAEDLAHLATAPHTLAMANDVAQAPALRAVAPAVAVPDQTFEQMGLERLRPAYRVYADDWKTLAPTRKLLDPITVSPSDPQVIDLLEQTPGFEPDLGFIYFVRGAATVSLIIEPAYHEAIKAVLQDVGASVLNGEGLPPLDRSFADDMNQVIKVIMNNGEAISWRSLIAFSTGVFWLLSFVMHVDQKRGTITPREWGRRLCTFWATLQYVPTSS